MVSDPNYFLRCPYLSSKAQILIGIISVLLGLILAIIALTPSESIIRGSDIRFLKASKPLYLNISELISLNDFELSYMEMNITHSCTRYIELAVITEKAIIMKFKLSPNIPNNVVIKNVTRYDSLMFTGSTSCSIEYSYSIHGLRYPNLGLGVIGLILGILGGYIGTRGIVNLISKRG